MLRAARPALRFLHSRAPTHALHHGLPVARGGVVAVFQIQRGYVERKTADSAVFPGSQSAAVPDDISTPAILLPSSANPPPTILLDNIPRTPPSPEEVGSTIPESTATTNAIPLSTSRLITDTPAPTSTTPPTLPPSTGTGTASTGSSIPPLPQPKKPRKTFRRLLYLITLLGLAYGGGTYYALVNDNFHDFFTEYVPYGEEAVLYFEEREFKRRFADRSRPSASKMYPQVSGEKKVTIGGKSGMEPRVTQDTTSDLSSKGPHVSALSSSGTTTVPPADKPKEVQQAVAKGGPAQPAGSGVVDKNAEPAKATPLAKTKDQTPTPKLPSDKPPAETTAIPPPAPKPVVLPIDPLKVDNAGDPVVQEITKLVNDLIQVVNADGAADLYRTTMDKAKDGVHKLASDIQMYRKADSLAAEEKLKEERAQFDKAALELVQRVRDEQKEQELRWREEYEAERQHLAESYQQKLKAELDAAEKTADQRRENELVQQDIKMKESFMTSVRDRVETERGGRLSKLTQLTSTVSELEDLTSKWNEIVDANLKSQHLLVAVEALKSTLEDAERPTPFIQELAALKEVASDDSVINAAVATINPAAYQLGVPTSAQLIDRFRRVAAEVRKAALLPEDAGVASHAASLVLSKVMFKKNGLAVGEDVESILTRTETLLEEGDLDEAAREMNGLQGWAKVLSKDWLAECRGVLEVKQALDVIATEARLRSLLVE